MNKFEMIRNYIDFKRKYKDILSSGLYKGVYKVYTKDKRIQTPNYEFKLILNESYKEAIRNSIEARVSKLKKEDLILTNDEVKKINIGIDGINNILQENPKITLSDLLVELRAYPYIRDNYKSLDIYKFLYTFFNNFPDGYYVRTLHPEAICNILCVFPIDGVK